MPLNTARLRGTVCALPVLLMLNAAAPAQTRASDPGQTNAAQPPAMPAPIQDPPTAEAPAIQIDGPASQGSLNLGRVPKGWQVAVDGVPARVDDSGRFVFGIGRDAATADLVARAPHGATLERRVTVAARDWAIERIDGLAAADG